MSSHSFSSATSDNGSVGEPPDTDEPDVRNGTCEDAQRQPSEAKPSSVKSGSKKKKGRRPRRKLNFRTGEFEEVAKNFEEYTVGELRTLVEGPVESDAKSENVDAPDGSPERSGSLLKYHLSEMTESWIDGPELNIFDEEDEDKPGGETPAELLGFSWRSEAEEWGNKKWVKVDSVVDSGASVPVAPPTMLPNVKIVPSEGSKRGQRFTSASKHKLKNLGQQVINACSEDGQEMQVLFQIADVSKPLVSVSSICERGSRVISGRAGGVVQNVHSGAGVPFCRRNGIYVLSMWLADPNDSDFHGR